LDLTDPWFAKEDSNKKVILLSSMGRTVTLDNLEASERVFIKITELALDLSFAAKKRLLLGGGLFVSVWSDAPVAAGWGEANFNWQLRRASPIYAGLSTVAGIRF